MCSDFRYFSVFDDDDAVGMRNRRQTMGDDERRPVFRQLSIAS